jgi:hypothetical protein
MKTEDKVRSWVCVGCSSDVTSPIPNIEQSFDNMFNLTSIVLSDTAGNTIKTDVLPVAARNNFNWYGRFLGIFF